MKKTNLGISILLIFIILFFIPATAFAASPDRLFSDVKNDAWYSESIKYCVENGLMSGTATDAFSPDVPMSRAMLATVLYRVAENPNVTGTANFSDVAPDTWYTDAIIWSAQNGIMSGYGSGLFGTNDPVTREQIATILWRYSGSNISVESGAGGFADTAEISSFALEAVQWAKNLGIVNGKSGNLFDPKSNATRAEVATILHNYFRNRQHTATELEPEGDFMNISIVVGNSTFKMKLYNNDTAKALLTQLPMTLDMSELNGNEKYFFLSDSLPTASELVGNIRVGDLMLYGSDCLVLFYESFSTSYNYTKIGYIEDVSGLNNALGSGNVTVTFGAD